MPERWESLVAGVGEAVAAHQVVLLVHDAGSGGLRPLAYWGSGPPVEAYIPLAPWALERGGTLALHGQTLADSPFPFSPHAAIITAPVPARMNPPGLLVALLKDTPPQQLPALRERLLFLAGLAGELLEVSVLEETLRQKEQQLQDLAQATVDVRETERQLVSLEIHDTVTQTLTSAFHHLQALEALAAQEGSAIQGHARRASDLVRQAIQECRVLIDGLQPATLHPDGLVASLRHELDQMAADCRWQTSLHAPPEIRLPQWMETHLFRIVREALSNASKHASASRVWVRVEAAIDRLSLEVGDDGCGFDPQAVEAAPGKKGLGLLSMRHRAGLLRGTCTVSSQPGRGTTVRVEIPLTGWQQA